MAHMSAAALREKTGRCQNGMPLYTPSLCEPSVGLTVTGKVSCLGMEASRCMAASVGMEASVGMGGEREPVAAVKQRTGRAHEAASRGNAALG